MWAAPASVDVAFPGRRLRGNDEARTDAFLAVDRPATGTEIDRNRRARASMT
jgi:hypothetical protein